MKLHLKLSKQLRCQLISTNIYVAI